MVQTDECELEDRTSETVHKRRTRKPVPEARVTPECVRSGSVYISRAQEKREGAADGVWRTMAENSPGGVRLRHPSW